MTAVTYNFTDGTQVGHPAPHDTQNKGFGIYTRRNVIDFAVGQTLTDSTNDVAQVIKADAGSICLGVLVRIITAETASGEIDIGVGTAGVEWGSAMNIAGSNMLVPIFVAPYYFATADTIDISQDTTSGSVDIDGAKLEVIALFIDSSSTIDAL